MTERKPKGKTFEFVYEAAKDLFEVGAITKERMLEYEAKCLVPLPSYTPRQIQAMRKREQLSQERFAYALNVSVSAVRKWEIGEKKPSGASLKLLHLFDRLGVNGMREPG
ncbi:MAG: helix-turn-helix domain-containing protein [bacterium]